MQDLPEQYPGTTGADIPLARKSWAAYVAPVTVAAVALLGFVPFLWVFFHPLAIAVAVITIGATTYTVALLRSYQLFMDERGVWLYRGILPWNKGVIGVRWRDVAGAVYFNSFMSWVCQAYSIEVQHRFTQGNALWVGSLHFGRDAVARINEAHQDYVSQHGTQN